MTKLRIIRDTNGKPINRSRNLRGIREYVGKHRVKILSIDTLPEDGGKLCILFSNGSSFETNFSSYEVLKKFVQCWRNVYGALLQVNGELVGKVSYNNPAFKK